MPYSHHREGKKEVVTKANTGEVVGHTTPGKLNAYLAALHMHSKDMSEGGAVPYRSIIEELLEMLSKK